MRTTMRWLVLLGLLAAMGSAQALSRAQQRSLEQVQAAYAAAIRWNDLDTAAEMVDPEYRRAHPQSELERERYQQVQISGYRELRSGADGQDKVLRDVEIRVINRNTQAERSVRVRESWRWDAQAKQWWLTSGLPDLWRGE
ncbi:MAG TPA: hypothetical protein DDZ67_02245 [Xanthomonadaceae bacterium]|nr:hypothetical protein [Xanthomonadaceae bacterium]